MVLLSFLIPLIDVYKRQPTMVAGMFPPCNRFSMKGVISLNPVAMERILKPTVPA